MRLYDIFPQCNSQLLKKALLTFTSAPGKMPVCLTQFLPWVIYPTQPCFNDTYWHAAYKPEPICAGYQVKIIFDWQRFHTSPKEGYIQQNLSTTIDLLSLCEAHMPLTLLTTTLPKYACV
jgi:hypothetical protein